MTGGGTIEEDGRGKDGYGERSEEGKWVKETP